MTASTSFNRTIVIIVAAATILLETLWDVLDNLLIVTILSYGFAFIASDNWYHV
jgi:hypothetical protein